MVPEIIEMAQKPDPTKEIIASLASKDNSIVLNAIKRIKSHGNEQIIEPLVITWATTKSSKIHDEITGILYNLRDERAVAPLVKSLELPVVSKYKSKLLAAFWNMQLEVNEHIDTFVKTAIDGDYITCVECMTIIENMNPPFQEELLLDSMLMLKESLANNPGDKEPLLADMLELLEQIDKQQ